MTTLASTPADEIVEVADPRQLNRAMWSNPDNGLWVARSDEGYLGMVENDIVGYKVTDSRGSMVGTFDDLETAKNIISMEFRVDRNDTRDLRRAFVATVIIGATAVSVSGAAVAAFAVSN